MKTHKKYKGYHTQTNVTKLNLYLPTYNGKSLATKSTKSFISRSVSGLKRFTKLNHNESPSPQKHKSQNSIKIHSPKNTRKVKIQPIDIRQHNLKSSVMTPVTLSCKNQQPSNKTQSIRYFKQNNQLKGQKIRKILYKMNRQTDKLKQKQASNKAKFNIKPFKKLASGQYGNIYLAYSLDINMIFALKCFNKSKVNLDFMIDEFKIQLYCRHPNILPAYGFYIGKVQSYLIMEAGLSNLYSKLKREGCFSQNKSANYLFQIMKGLSYLHLNGVIHRDLKPENVIVCGGDTLKITDFGWSIISDSQRTTYCGTIDYVSPEVSSGKLYDNKIDCWSVGILAFQMILGYPPFPVKSTEGSYPCLNYEQKIIFPSDISVSCQKFIRKMLKRDSKNRPTINEAIQDEWIQQNVKLSREQKQIQQQKLMMNNLLN